MAPALVADLGGYLREQRVAARLSLRQLSELAGISNPYLSQIERGLKRPSAQILQQLAYGLQMSAESLYIKAGILQERSDRAATPGVLDAIAADPYLTPRQRGVLVEVYRAFAGWAVDRGKDHAPAPAAKTTVGRTAAPTAANGPTHQANPTVPSASDRSTPPPRLTATKGDTMATPSAETSADMKKLVTDVYLTPAYFAVGLTDMTVEKMRQANLFDPIAMRKDFSAQAEKVIIQTWHAQARLLQHSRRLSQQAQVDYVELAERGEQVIERIRGQQATQDLLTQLDNTVSITRGEMSTARTRAAASRTSGVGNSRAKNTSSRAKATANSARKSASKARAAANAAAEQVG